MLINGSNELKKKIKSLSKIKKYATLKT
jgi:hypothetical protein